MLQARFTVGAGVTGSEVIIYFMPNSAEHDFFLFINVKMPTILDISTSMSRKKIASEAYLSLEEVEFLDTCIVFTYEHLKVHAQLKLA